MFRERADRGGAEQLRDERDWAAASKRFALLTLGAVLVLAFGASPTLAGAAAPPAGSSLYWQLSGTVPSNPDFDVVDIDGFDNSASKFTALTSNGKYTVAYF